MDSYESPREERGETSSTPEVDTDAGDKAEPERDIAATEAPQEKPSRPDAKRPPRRGRPESPGKIPSGPPSRPPQANGSGAHTEFRSEHIITNPEAVKKLPPARVRSKPFEELQATMAPNSVVFDSNNLFAPAGRDASAKVAEETKVAEGKSSGGGSGGRTRKSGAKSASSGGKGAEKKGRRPPRKAAKPSEGDAAASTTAETDPSAPPAKKSAGGSRKTGGRKPAAKRKKPAKTDTEQAAV